MSDPDPPLARTSKQTGRNGAMNGVQLATSLSLQEFPRRPLGRLLRSAIQAIMLEADKAVPAQDSATLVDLMTAIADDRDCEAFACLFDHIAPRMKACMRCLGVVGEAWNICRSALDFSPAS